MALIKLLMVQLIVQEGKNGTKNKKTDQCKIEMVSTTIRTNKF